MGLTFAMTTALTAALLCLAAAQTETPPDPNIFAQVRTAGAVGTGFPAFYVGCTGNGATLQDLTVYANDNFLRGIEVSPAPLFPMDEKQGRVLVLCSLSRTAPSARESAQCCSSVMMRTRVLCIFVASSFRLSVLYWPY